MKLLRAIPLLLAVLFGTVRADYVDRVVASVNGAPILWSDVEREVRFEALMQGVPLTDITIQQRNQALNRLIDNRLMSQQINETHADFDEEQEQSQIAKLISDLRAQRHAASSDSAWKALLLEYGLNEADLNAHLRDQTEALEFVDLRFRSGVQVTPQQIDAYYQNVFTPEMKQRGSSVPALASVRPKIEQILLEQGITESMNEWLKVVRNAADTWRASPFDAMSVTDTGRN